MLIDSAHAEEIRVAVVDDGKLDRFDFETPSKAQIRGNIYLAKVVRVEPSLQAAFVDYGGDRHGFLGFSEIHHSYFQIPVGDRQKLEEHLHNAMAARMAENGESEEEVDPREISRLRHQFYRHYKIQEVIKKRQIMLVQVMKEERGNKGAALTTYISLAGRYCVLMPNTAKGGGVSRKVSNPKDRQKLKKIVAELKVENGSAVIRTAGIGHTKAEIKKDFDYLMKLWDEIRENTLKSEAPALIYEEASIIKRAIRDLYSPDIESIYVEGESGHKIARDFVKKLMPRQAKNVKLYNDPTSSLFNKFGVNDQINQIYSTRVDLPSGGYLVINTTEALISIDVNSGRSIRERNVAGTALKTNLEASVEVARQCRLRDLAGLIVVDFIDMDDRQDNQQVEKSLRETLRSDKAKIQVGSISNFGLLEMSRQRLRSSIVDVNMIPCPHCNGIGYMWSGESMAIQVLRKIEEACLAFNYEEIKVTLSTTVALYIMNNKRSFISDIEKRRNLKIIFHIDPYVANTDFKIEQLTKRLPESDEDAEEKERASNSRKSSAAPMEVASEMVAADDAPGKISETEAPVSKRGRRRRRRGENRGNLREESQDAVVDDSLVELQNGGNLRRRPKMAESNQATMTSPKKDEPAYGVDMKIQQKKRWNEKQAADSGPPKEDGAESEKRLIPTVLKISATARSKEGEPSEIIKKKHVGEKKKGWWNRLLNP
jgi:ribonuclease E